MKDQTMMSAIDDETLMAFADGRLDGQRFETVANALETDPLLAERLAQLAEGARLARDGYGQLLDPVPPALEANVRAAIARANHKPFWQRALDGLRLEPLWATAMAAGVAALIALPTGFLLRGDNPAPTGFDLASQPALARALDTLLSGETGSLPNGSEVTAIASFTDGEGTLCREFEASGGQHYLAIACRVDGHWQTRLAMAAEAQTDGAYRPASGTELVDAFLDTIGASAPLLDAEERAALERP